MLNFAERGKIGSVPAGVAIALINILIIHS
jgi:hypothetical protein